MNSANQQRDLGRIGTISCTEPSRLYGGRDRAFERLIRDFTRAFSRKVAAARLMEAQTSRAVLALSATPPAPGSLPALTRPR